mgnify:CR=1 FL=1
MNLSILLKKQGKTAEAEALYQEVIAGRTEHYGPTHTSTLTTKMNLALLLANEGNKESNGQARSDEGRGRALLPGFSADTWGVRLAGRDAPPRNPHELSLEEYFPGLSPKSTNARGRSSAEGW